MTTDGNRENRGNGDREDPQIMSRGSFLGLGGMSAAALALGVGAFSGAEALAQTGSRVTNIAHRGASGSAPENTLLAVRRAIEFKADFVEVDVQRSADGELVLFHDTTLTRTTDVEEVYPERAPYRVGDFTLAELKRLDAGFWFSAEFAGERIPTLGEILPVLQERAGLLLEMKNSLLYPGIEQDISEELERSGFAQSAAASGRLVVQSFDRLSVRRYHQLQPEVPVGALFATRPTEVELQETATYAQQANPSFRNTDRPLVERIHELGLTTSVYTVNEPEDMRRMIELGVDGIITNFPEVLRRVAGRPGQRNATSIANG